MHLRLLGAAVVVIAAASIGPGSGQAALPQPDPADELARIAPAAGPADEADAGLSEDQEALLAATLLVGRMGPEAAGFAAERARRFEAEREPGLARLWRDIAVFARGLYGRLDD